MEGSADGRPLLFLRRVADQKTYRDTSEINADRNFGGKKFSFFTKSLDFTLTIYKTVIYFTEVCRQVFLLGLQMFFEKRYAICKNITVSQYIDYVKLRCSMFKFVRANGRVWKSSTNQRRLLHEAFQKFWNVGVFFFVDTNTETFVKYILFRKPRGDFWKIVQRDFWLANNDDLFYQERKKQYEETQTSARC